MNPIRIASTAIATLSVVALSGCALAVYVGGGSGIGTCEGKGDVSIATTQTELGDSFTIDYYGPGDVTLAVVQGFYSENNFYDLAPTRLAGFGSDEDNPSVNVSVVGDEAGWRSHQRSQVFTRHTRAQSSTLCRRSTLLPQMT